MRGRWGRCDEGESGEEVVGVNGVDLEAGMLGDKGDCEVGDPSGECEGDKMNGTYECLRSGR